MARGRPKKRDTRMDAAVDTMAGFGFPVAKVKKHVRLLLKVYGGDDGWPFIEEYSYKELLEAMLRVRDVEDEKDQETKTLTDGSDVGTSTRDEGPRDNGSPENTAIMPSGASTPEANNGGHLSNDVEVQPDNSLPPHGHRRKPCYGWIESDDDEDGFVYLKPLPGRFGEKVAAFTTSNDRTRSREKRRSRWDLKPHDP